jgi:hypothetical protein
MKTTLLSAAFLLSVLAVNAQTEKKQATVHIKKVEKINGVEKVTDTTFTTSEPVRLADGKDVQFINMEGEGDDKTKKVFVTRNGHIITKDNSEMITTIELNTNDETNDDVQKMFKEAGIDPKDCKGDKKIVLITEDVEGGKDGKKETKTTKIVMIRMNITDASTEDMKRLGTQIGKADNKLEMEEMKMAPNPHDGKFELSFNLKNKGDAKVNIFNTEGKEVYSESLPNFSGEYKKNIDISSNQKGIYFVKIEQGKHTQVKKVVLE